MAVDVNRNENLLWDVRAYIYQHVVSTGLPPTAPETAIRFGLDETYAAALYRELDLRHLLFLEPGTTSIRIVSPFSGVPTPFRVLAWGEAYWANCAWDMLGIPAVLQCDVEIEATLADTGERMDLAVRGGRPTDNGERVHFLVPFRHWYDDLIHT